MRSIAMWWWEHEQNSALWQGYLKKVLEKCVQGGIYVGTPPSQKRMKSSDSWKEASLRR